MNSNTPTQTATSNPASQTSTQPAEMPVAWREFAAGMEFLRRYGAHNTANTAAISRDNLRLLHRSLLQDSDYRHQVHNACKGMPQYGRPTRTTLLNSSQLSAQLIHIPANSNIRLTVSPSKLGMLMVLSGALGTDAQTAAKIQTSWWNRGWKLKGKTRSATCQLKTDDILCIRQSDPDSEPRMLTSGKKSCVVLAVFCNQQNPATHTSAQTAAVDFPPPLLQGAL